MCRWIKMDLRFQNLPLPIAIGLIVLGCIIIIVATYYATYGYKGRGKTKRREA